ncbi:MAG TPA: LbetaH domain-containing protein [Candidatus Azoamicus sp.]
MRYISDKAIIIEPLIVGKNVYIGPYSIIGPNVEIGENTWIDSYVRIAGSTCIGSNNKFSSFSNIGISLKENFNKDFSCNLTIGNNNFFGEGVSVCNGLISTSIGNNNYFMHDSYISNDCILSSNIFFSNNVFVSSHVLIDDFAIVSRFVNICNNVYIGAYSFLGSNSIVCYDAFPYSLVSGAPASFNGLNLVCLKKNFFSKNSILKLKKIYKFIFCGNLSIKELIFILSSKKYFSIESNQLIKFLLKSKKIKQSCIYTF